MTGKILEAIKMAVLEIVFIVGCFVVFLLVYVRYTDIKDAENVVDNSIYADKYEAFYGEPTAVLGNGGITDRVAYMNLDPNTTYTIKASIIDKDSGETVTSNTYNFDTDENPDGNIIVSYGSTDLEPGDYYVVHEEIEPYEEKNK